MRRRDDVSSPFPLPPTFPLLEKPQECELPCLLLAMKDQAHRRRFRWLETREGGFERGSLHFTVDRAKLLERDLEQSRSAAIPRTLENLLVPVRDACDRELAKLAERLERSD